MAVVKSFNVLPQVIADVAEIIKNHAGKKIIWFGYSYSHWVDTLQAALKEQSLKLDYIIDNDPLKWGRVSPFDIIVSPPQHTISCHMKDSIVLICSNFSREIAQGILEYGYPIEQIITLKSPEIYSQAAREVFASDIEGLSQMGLRQLQLCGVDILKELKKYCDVNGLRYFLSGGTCCGAAKYKGFIPWDDDIDVQMPYEDFMKLVHTFPKGGRYELVFWKDNDEFFFPYAQLVDNRTVMIYKSFPISMSQSVFIDIFPTAGSPENDADIKYRYALNCYLDTKWRWFYNSRGVLKDTIIDCRQEIWDKKYDLYFNNSEWITSPFEFGYSYIPWVLPKTVFEYGETLEFEGEEFSVMKDWKRFLAARYPVWKPLSPEEQRAYSHPSNAYWK